MMTFDNIIYGPVRSRRLGVSLGVNVMPKENKVCSFECIYCECGFTKKGVTGHIPTVEEISSALETSLKSMRDNNETLDVITFAGNGEPTMHPKFLDVIKETIRLRNLYVPKAKVSVLSNSMHLGRQDVIEALKLTDNNILKLDSAITETVKSINLPNRNDFKVDDIIDKLRLFDGDFILQTMFLRGTGINGESIDNTTQSEVEEWIKVVRSVKPKQVMVYSIDRETPVKTLEKVSKDELYDLVRPLVDDGFDVLVAG